MFLFGVDYEPTAKQKKWHEEGFAMGGRGSGKSTFIVMEALKQAVENDGIKVYVVAADYYRVEYLLRIFIDRVPRDCYGIRIMTHEVTLKNGSKIHFVSKEFLEKQGYIADVTCYDQVVCSKTHGGKIIQAVETWVEYQSNDTCKHINVAWEAPYTMPCTNKIVKYGWCLNCQKKVGMVLKQDPEDEMQTLISENTRLKERNEEMMEVLRKVCEEYVADTVYHSITWETYEQAVKVSVRWDDK